MRVVVLGQGYVGLPLAMEAVAAGHQVIGLEPDDRRRLRLDASDSYVEDVPSERIRAALDSGRYSTAASMGQARAFDVAVITVPTPLKDRTPDLSYVKRAAHMLGPWITRGAVVVLESTTYPGTTEDVLVPILERRSGLVAGTDFHVGFSPERIDPGNATWHFRNTPKVVSGLTPACLEKVRAFYDLIVDRTIPAKGLREAELAKVLENTFRHVNIAMLNELAKFTHLLGVDVWDAIDLASTKPFGYMPFRPGPGVGGHCLPIDPVYLSWQVKQELGENFRFIELANEVNEQQPAYVVQRLQDGLNARGKALKGAPVTVLGLTYKAGTSDVRESPAERVVHLLRAKGADLLVVDPHVSEWHSLPDVRLVKKLAPAMVTAADAVIVLTDHPEFDMQMVREHAAYVFDTRRSVPAGANVELL
ncbi:nucleotide sugar dehydrogenase [Streptomyces sp. NPDC002896]|uniref:nucleotide sugar dehydrogenase n=1 Tax=Streptomyces sp. NPDC002896 TaxID=3154438 RepID=UPI00331F6189